MLDYCSLNMRGFTLAGHRTASSCLSLVLCRDILFRLSCRRKFTPLVYTKKCAGAPIAHYLMFLSPCQSGMAGWPESPPNYIVWSAGQRQKTWSHRWNNVSVRPDTNSYFVPFYGRLVSWHWCNLRDNRSESVVIHAKITWYREQRTPAGCSGIVT